MSNRERLKSFLRVYGSQLEPGIPKELMAWALAEIEALQKELKAGKKPDFGKHRIEEQGIVLECDYAVPGLTMHDLVMIFEKARKEAKPGDELAGNPARWPNVRGVRAVTDAILEAFGYEVERHDP